MCLLLNLTTFGKLKSAMYDEGFAKLTLVDEDTEYAVSVIKRTKTEDEKDA